MKGTRLTYDRLSEEAEEQLSLWLSNPYDRSLYEGEVEFVSAHLPSRGTVLELGCGWDPYNEPFLKGLRSIALDFSAESIRKAACGGPGPHLLIADANSIPFRDATVDLVIATDELICSDTIDPSRLLAGAARVLKDADSLIIEYDTKWCLDSLWMLLDSHVGNRIGYEVSREQMRKLFGHRGGGVITWGLAGSEDRLDVRFFTTSEIDRLLAEAGFRVVRRVSINLLSGMVPTVTQQRTTNRILLTVSNLLAKADRFAGRLPVLNSFGGDVLVLARKDTA